MMSARSHCMYCNGKGYFRDNLSGTQSYCSCEEGRGLEAHEAALRATSKVEQKTVGGIIRPDPETPQRLIRELLDLATERCCVCKKLATRQGKLSTLILAHSGFFFCDVHSILDIPKLEQAAVEYRDLEHAPLLRRCMKWLEENKVEEKTAGGV